MNAQPPKNQNPDPLWWKSLKPYLTDQQQAQFRDCYNYLFGEEHRLNVLWAIVNILGLLGLILHKIVQEMSQLHEKTGQLHQAILELEYSVRTASAAVTESALRAHEASFELRRATMPWEKAITIALLSCTMTAITVFSVMCFHDASHDWRALPVQSEVGHS